MGEGYAPLLPTGLLKPYIPGQAAVMAPGARTFSSRHKRQVSSDCDAGIGHPAGLAEEVSRVNVCKSKPFALLAK